ncbi:unnamed protein product [Agarophyton chilense]
MRATIREAHEAGLAMGSYMREHGLCHLPCPAEFLYTGGLMGVRIRTCEMDEADFTCSNTPTIMSSDYKDTDRLVKYQAISPASMGVGKMGREPQNMRKSCAYAERAVSRSS